jgi:hypothetical protein
MSSPIVLGVTVVAMNVPFGYWRSGTQRFSRAWFLAVHAPVPLVVALRLAAGVPWRIGSFLLLGSAFFVGQLLGEGVRFWRERNR